jgi:CheY-like chemotaxis protein
MVKTAAKKAHSVLIVEDEQPLNEAYQIILRQAGYTVFSAYDGKEALNIATNNKVNLILLDLRMPNMDGLSFLRTYNLKVDHPKVKVIIFSNFDMQDEIDEAYQHGADRYILKAWASPKELLKIVEDTLKTPKA